MLPTLLGGGNNLTISVDNGTYVLAYGSEALISGPPVQACNVSGAACRLLICMHAYVSLGRCVRHPVTCAACGAHGSSKHSPWGCYTMFIWLPGCDGSKLLPCKCWTFPGVTAAQMACK